MTSFVPWNLETVVENPDEPHTAQEMDAELDVRLEALRRGRTQWGCTGQHRGRYTQAQIDAGAPECPIWMHHHHDAFCREPSPLELRLADAEKPASGWGQR